MQLRRLTIAVSGIIAATAPIVHAQVMQPQQLPPAGTSGIFTGTTNSAQQGLYNFLAFPIGTVNTPTGPKELEYRFSLPVVMQNPTMIQTDMTPVPNSGQRIKDGTFGPDRNWLPPDTVVVARDHRHQYGGNWIPIKEGQTQVAMKTSEGTRTYLAVLPRVSDLMPGSSDKPHIMPTVGSSYAMSAGNEVTLNQGSLLVKGGKKPFYVLLPMKGDTTSVRVEQGNFIMVSNLDGHVCVANLADSHNLGCTVMLNDHARKSFGEMPVRIGYMIEVYANELSAGENRIAAYKVINQLKLSNGYSVETMRVNYPRALKRFNLTKALPKADFDRLVKTAAAVAYLDRGQAL